MHLEGLHAVSHSQQLVVQLALGSGVTAPASSFDSSWHSLPFGRISLPASSFESSWHSRNDLFGFRVLVQTCPPFASHSNSTLKHSLCTRMAALLHESSSRHCFTCRRRLVSSRTALGRSSGLHLSALVFYSLGKTRCIAPGCVRLFSHKVFEHVWHFWHDHGSICSYQVCMWHFWHVQV